MIPHTGAGIPLVVVERFLLCLLFLILLFFLILMMHNRNYESNRKHLKSWETLFPWCGPSPNKPKQTYCKVCSVNLVPSMSSLQRHAKSKTHNYRMESISNHRYTLVSYTHEIQRRQNVPASLRKAELRFALTVACHCPMLTIDHFGDNIKKHAGRNSILSGLKLHRTKCTAIIKNVIAPFFREQIKKDIAGKRFSLLFDESTDITVKKHVVFSVRYFSEQNKCIVDAFLGLYRVPHATAENLFALLQECLTWYGINLQDCVGVGCDGASTMVGEHNSLFSRIKAVNPNIVLNKCVCHSLALCVKYAFELLPSCIGFMLSFVPKWFANSDKRRTIYQTLFDTMNNNTEENEVVKRTPFMKLSFTRWLVRGRVLKRILTSWNYLKQYFQEALPSCSQQQRYKVRQILEMLNDDMNRLVFEFATPIVLAAETVNAFFQSKNADAYEMFTELETYSKTLKARVINHMNCFKNIGNVDFGRKFEMEVGKILNVHEGKPTYPAIANGLNTIKVRCHEFLKELYSQVKNRMESSSIECLKGMAAFSPKNNLSQVSRSNFSDLPLLHLISPEDLSEVEEQYRRVVLFPWVQHEAFQDVELRDITAERFWVTVYYHKLSNNLFPFRKLVEYALACLSMPISSAQVERLFNQVTIVQTKYRNILEI